MAARFSHFAAEHMKPLYRYAYWLSRDAGAAEDLVQEALGRAWSAFGALRDERAGKAWLFTILRREFLRRPPPAHNHLPLEDEVADETYAPGYAVEVMDVRLAIGRLAPEYREALMLQTMDGFSLEEIGRLLGIPANTAATRVFRARLQLREMLSETAPAAKATGGRR